MKNIKNILISIVSIVAFASSQSAVAAQQFAQKTSALTQQLSTKNPGFSLRNKSGNNITYTLTAGDNLQSMNTITESTILLSGQEDQKNVQPSLFAKLTINPGTSNQRVYTIKPQRKTIYLTLEGTNLRPAGATLKSLKSETESGLPVGFMGATNVKQDEIQ